MKGNVTGENDRSVGLHVIDNNGTTHKIEMRKRSGEIYYHEQDGYSDDPVARTPEENEHVNQARRYARYHVYRERGYGTLERVDNPDCILAAMIALGQLSPTAFETHFRALFDRLRRHADGSRVDLPFAGADPDGIVVYRTDLYLEPDPVGLQETIRDALSAYGVESGATVDGEALAATLEDLHTDPSVDDALAFDLEAVSEPYVLYNDGYNNEQQEDVTQPLEREPDARLEPMPLELESLEAFREYLLAHLAHQVRDCYLCMGVEPPGGFRQPGYGTYRAALYQRSSDLYEPYYDESATIESWQPGH